jgi:hypothetical protein
MRRRRGDWDGKGARRAEAAPAIRLKGGRGRPLGQNIRVATHSTVVCDQRGRGEIRGKQGRMGEGAKRTAECGTQQENSSPAIEAETGSGSRTYEPNIIVGTAALGTRVSWSRPGDRLSVPTQRGSPAHTYTAVLLDLCRRDTGFSTLDGRRPSHRQTFHSDSQGCGCSRIRPLSARAIACAHGSQAHPSYFHCR